MTDKLSTHRHALMYCPSCLHHMTAATNTEGTAAPSPGDFSICIEGTAAPSPGDFSICIECAAVLRFRDDMTLGLADADELREVANESPETVIGLMVMQRRIREGAALFRAPIGRRPS